MNEHEQKKDIIVPDEGFQEFIQNNVDEAEKEYIKRFGPFPDAPGAKPTPSEK